MSEVKSAFKALTPEQQAIVTERRVAGERTPDEWLRLLGPVGEFDRQADAVREGGGGFWARRYARKRDVPNGLRSFALPLMAILREDHDPDAPLALAIDLTGTDTTAKIVNVSPKYQKGPYTVTDTYYDDPWLRGTAHFADGARLEFSVVDHLRRSDKSKRNPRGKLKRKVKHRRKAELTVTLSAPGRNYASAHGHARAVPKEKVKPGESRTTVTLSGMMDLPAADTVPPLRMLLELISGAYERVEPARRKKL